MLRPVIFSISISLTVLSISCNKQRDSRIPDLNKKHIDESNYASNELLSIPGFNPSHHEQRDMLFTDTATYLIFPLDNALQFYQLSKKKIVHSLEFPTEIEGNYQSYDVHGLNDAVVWIGNDIYRNKDNKIDVFNIGEGNDSVKWNANNPLVYFSDLNKIVIQFARTALPKRNFYYDFNHLGQIDLVNGNFSEIDLHHDSYYNIFSRTPETCLSRTGNHLIVSEKRSPNVYNVDMENYQVEIINIEHPKAMLNQLPSYSIDDKNLSKKWEVNRFLFEEYGLACFDPKDNLYYRIYYHRLPIDPDSSYITNSLKKTDKLVSILRYDPADGSLTCFDLTARKLYKRDFIWLDNQNEASLYYINYILNNDGENRTHILEKFRFYSFSQ